MSGFFEEVKRRKVYRVAAAYVIAAGGTIQLASAAFPAWGLPNGALKWVILPLLVGFPIALILSWLFDVTPEGIKTTPAIAGPGSNRRRNVTVLIAAGVLISAAAGFFVLPRATAHKVDKSIAVLPFQSFSDDKENAYFADGIQDDILTNLSKISDLKVISRTSVMKYRGQTIDIREIGKTLGVSTILEGSVRREGNRVRVSVQLINANDDEHLWANNYDRDLVDVFAIQTDLAREIANALQAKLSDAEKAQMARRPTESGEAYLAFVQAHNLQGAYEDVEKLKQGEQLYDRAIELDPQFALALARYSQLESWMQHSFGRSPELRQKARTLAESALKIQPDLPEAHLAMGFSYYYGDNNYDAALREFQTAQVGLPNDSEAYLAIGAIQRRQGKWPESTANFKKSASLNPRDSWPLQNLAFNYVMVRDYDAANQTLDQALKISPAGIGLWEVKSKVAIAEKGDFSVAEKACEAMKSAPLSPELRLKLASGLADLFLLQRKYKEGLQEAESLPDDALKTFPGALAGKYFLVGFARKALHDEAGSRAAFLKSKGFLEAQLKQTPDEAGVHLQLGKVLANLGEKEAALAAAQRAVAIEPESKDAFEGPDITAGLAEVYCIVGDNGRAIELLDGLLSRPSNVSVPGLRVSPAWDSLRSDPRFQALLDKHGGKT
ncbi:MAG: hypothetical protein ABI925_12880 [Verrucomicrobiota bacterium]